MLVSCDKAFQDLCHSERREESLYSNTSGYVRLPSSWGLSGPLFTCCGRGCTGVGARHCPLGLHALWELSAAGSAGGRPQGGVACHRCEGCLVSDTVPPPAARPLGRVAGVPRPVCPRCGWCGPGDPAPALQRAPLRAGVARVGVAEGRPRGGAFHCCKGASDVRRSPLPYCLPTGRVVGVHYPRAVGAGVWVWGPNAVPLACMPCGGCVPRGWGGAVPGGVACRCCEGRLVWGALPPPAARPLGFRDPCVPGAVGAGVGTQHRFHSVRPCGPALLAVGVAEGRPRVGCLPPL